MHVVLGANGHIGSVVSSQLLERRESVLVVLHSESRAAYWKQRGARVAVADVHDTAKLRSVFGEGTRLFLLNPPAPPTTDTASEERKSVASILAALEGAPFEKIVAESTYGAQPGERIGDLGVLYELEKRLEAQPIPTRVIRGAYYMTNWDHALDSARKSGVVPTFFPPDFVLPMVDPADIGVVAARLMTSPATDVGHTHVEGPARYSSRDVAAAFGKSLGRWVEAVETPPDRWESTLASMGFSEPAARSFAGMTAAALKVHAPELAEVTRGPTTLEAYIGRLVARAGATP